MIRTAIRLTPEQAAQRDIHTSRLWRAANRAAHYADAFNKQLEGLRVLAQQAAWSAKELNAAGDAGYAFARSVGYTGDRFPTIDLGIPELPNPIRYDNAALDFGHDELNELRHED